MNRTSPTPSLDDIRREIDAVDAGLLALLEQRFAAVEKITAAKKHAGEDAGSPMRPGREAVILRRLDGLRRGHLPQALMVRLWRSIMSAATTVQANTTVHVSPVIMTDPNLVALVLEQFPGLRLNVADETALAATIAGTSIDVAIMPRGGSWIEALEGGKFGAARVIGCLPLVGLRNSAPDLLIFGHAKAEATGDDRTIAVLRAKSGFTAGLRPLWLEQRGDCTAFCFEGYLESGAPILAGLPIRIAGHFPSPLEPGK